MNLKHFYYRTYFEGFGQQYPRLDLRQPENKEERKPVDKANETLLKARNQRLTQALPAHNLAPADLGLADVRTLKMEVQNPGLLTGAGYPHEVAYAGEFKLGFHFDHTGGLPVLPGSTVKGTLRALWPQYDYAPAAPAVFKADKTAAKAALQHKKAAFIFSLLKAAGLSVPANTEAPEAARAFVHRVELALFEGWNTLTIDGETPEYLPGSKRAVFFDAFPVAPAGSARVSLLGRDALTPHGADPLKNPVPLPFVKVLPGVCFEFRFRLRELPVLEQVSLTPTQMLRLFNDLLERTGIGAKTNVGYGRLIDPARLPARPQKNQDGPGASRPDRPHTKPGGGGAPAPAQRPAPKREVKSAVRWKARDPIYGRVLEHQDKDVYFSSEQIADPGWLIRVKNAPLADRLTPGKVFKLSVSSVEGKDRKILATIADFTPLDD